MIRRDFIKLVAGALAVSQLPGVEVKHEESRVLDLDATPLEIMLLSTENVLLEFNTIYVVAGDDIRITALRL